MQKTTDLYSECIELQKRVIAADDATQSLMDLEMEFLKLEIRVKRRAAVNNLVPKGVGLYVGIVIVVIVFRCFDIPDFVTKTLGIKNFGELGRVLTSSIAGAFV
ncbi:MAG: hypothetical protein HQK95_09830, partial [Nitrospirae bacterium]|nr:hypothetical protein [Nitrospirota bacterium]